MCKLTSKLRCATLRHCAPVLHSDSPGYFIRGTSAPASVGRTAHLQVLHHQQLRPLSDSHSPMGAGVSSWNKQSVSGN